jgi:NADP-dependent 3-hydroxy acid dehydrogenase YdfG
MFLLIFTKGPMLKLQSIKTDVNVLGVVRVTKACLPLLREGGGRVINVASLAGINIYYA